jgi:hypothetical protein
MKGAIGGAGYIAVIQARAVKNNSGKVGAAIEKYPEKRAEFTRCYHIWQRYEKVVSSV